MRNQVLLACLNCIVLLLLFPYSIWFGIPFLISIGIVVLLVGWMAFLFGILVSHKQWRKALCLLALNLLVTGVFCVVFDIYERCVDWEFSEKPIMTEEDAKEFGVYVCEYQQVKPRVYHAVPIKGKLWACCYSNYPMEYKTKGNITVNPSLLAYMLEVEDGDNVYEQLVEKECYIEHLRRRIRDNDLPMLVHIRTLSDTMVVYINSFHYEVGRVDSITFVRKGEPNLSLYDPDNNDVIHLTRPRSLKDRIKDWFFVDEVRYYLKKRKLIEEDKDRMADFHR